MIQSGLDIVQSQKPAPIPHVFLSIEDQALLNGLAAMQLDYGQTKEAIALLILSETADPKNPDTLRLLTLAYIRLEWWEKAQSTLERFKKQTRQTNSWTHLYTSLVFLGTNKLLKARQHFRMFCQLKMKAKQ